MRFLKFRYDFPQNIDILICDNGSLVGKMIRRIVGLTSAFTPKLHSRFPSVISIIISPVENKQETFPGSECIHENPSHHHLHISVPQWGTY